MNLPINAGRQIWIQSHPGSRELPCARITLAMGAAALLAIAGCGAASGGNNATSSSAGSNPTSSSGGGATSPAGGASGGAGTGTFTLTGAVNGQFTAPAVDLAQREGKPAACGKQNGSLWDAQFVTGLVNGKTSSVRITAPNYSGSGTFTSDANAGDVIVKVGSGGTQWDTGVDKAWTLTINTDEKSGKLHAELKDTATASTATAETVDGTFSCP